MFRKSNTPTSTDRPHPSPWHALPAEEVLTRLTASSDGLTESEAEERLARYGPNKLPEQPPPSVFQIALRQCKSPLIYVLAIAAVVSLGIGDFKDAFFIIAVIVINAIIGGYQEWKAEQSSLALRKLLQIHATVQRDHAARNVVAELLVPGDTVLLESGNRVPADMRLLSAYGFEVDESLLTGESIPVVKNPDWSGEASTPLVDCPNMVSAGSVVTRGRAKGVVVATGAETRVGQLALDVMGEHGGKTPLLKRMERFTNVIAIVIVAAAILIGAMGFYFGNYTLTEMFLFSLALAVSAIPEGLPVGMTIARTVATTRLVRRKVIVRRLTAVEGLGSCTYIGTDKTGTLTCNELTVKEVHTAADEVFSFSGEGFVPDGDVTPADRGDELLRLAEAGVLCNEADLYPQDGTWDWRGDAVDVALLALGRKLGLQRDTMLDTQPLVNQIPFEPEHRFAATFHQRDGSTRVCVKGAPERIIAMCACDAELAQRYADAATHMAERGFRVLAFAESIVPRIIEPDDAPPSPDDMTFLGFVGMIDPLRAGVREAIHACHDAGVTVAMIKGDHADTALAIARDLGLAESADEVITGADLAQRSDEELASLIGNIHVFARVEPRQKLNIVQAARESGHFVAVTGDGVNDAPALRAANIGVAMGKSGTDVARDAAELVISDDDFSSIVNGIEEGRVAFDNIRKVIFLLVSTGAAELVLMTLAIMMGSPLPLLPVQILWLNLVTNGMQHVALAFEPNEGGVLRRKPRSPDEPIFNRLMIERTVIAAAVMGIAAFLAFQWLLPENATDDEIAGARNALLLLMVLFENIHLGNCRSETKSAFLMSPFRSPILMAGAIGAFLVHFTAMHVPIAQTMLGTAPLDPNTWIALAAIALIIFPVMELHKLSWKARYGPQKTAAR